MATVSDFEITFEDAEVALGIDRHCLSSKKIAYRISAGGVRSAWAVDIVNALRSKQPRLELTKMQMHLLKK